MGHPSLQTQSPQRITNSRMSNPNISGGGGPVGGTPRMSQSLPPARQSIGGRPAMNVPRGKRVVMRLRCRFRPLHEVYYQDGKIADQDADVIFLCGDGGRVKAHKIILASSSKFFTDVFIDQRPGEVCTVCVPDVSSEIIKLLLLMAYKENVVVTVSQIQQIQDCAHIFGMDLSRLSHESANDSTVDVRPGKVLDILRMKSPDKHIRPMTQVGSPIRRPMGGPPMIQNMQGGQSSIRKVPTAIRSGMHQDQRNFKPVGPGGGRPVAAQGGGGGDESDGSEGSYTFKLQGYEQHQERRKSKLTPRVETEMDDNDGDFSNTDPVEAQNMIKEWMAKVGKDNNHESKRPRLDSSGGGGQQGQLECTVCNATFVKESAWKWHEDHHVGLGLFKCNRCDILVKSARAIWLHEQNIHGLVGIDHTDLEEPRNLPPDFRVVDGKRQAAGPRTMIRNINGQPLQKIQQQLGGGPGGVNRNLAAMRLAQLKRMKAAKMGAGAAAKSGRPFPQTNYAIGIGHSVGTEQLDSKKVKQLHWLYVCAKCDNCSDSSSKALTHYRKCYPNEEAPFESTVTKYRQGFYGKSKCPLCPRRYAANGGFMIHCGHMHQDYRSLFSHTGAAEDKLKCVSCQKKFSLPDEFHDHLENGIGCTADPINEESMPLLTSANRSSNTNVSASTSSTTPVNERSKRRPIANSRYADNGDDGREETPPPPPPKTPAVAPRSARLAKRASLQAKALADGAAKDKEEKEVVGGKRRPSAGVIDYPPADCPICGASEVENISEHLASDHKDLDITVFRISTDLLRCKKCLTTFAICDLLGHTKTCESLREKNNKEEKEVPESPEISTPAAESTEEKEEEKPKPELVPIFVNKEDLPEGVGCSPIDRIEIVDLHSKEALEKAMICAVCGRTGNRLGDVAICLRAHGVHRCALCFNSYTNKNDYAQHLKICHGAVDSSNSKTKMMKLKCPLCNRTFINAGQVASHMYSIHWQSLLHEMKQSRVNGGTSTSTSDQENVSKSDIELKEDAPSGNEEEKVEEAVKPADKEQEEEQISTPPPEKEKSSEVVGKLANEIISILEAHKALEGEENE